jgi:exonuclease III
VVVGDFNIPESQTHRSSKQKFNHKILELNDTIDQMNLTDIYRIFHTRAQYTFFSAAHGTFSKTDHVLGHKAILTKYNRTYILINWKILKKWTNFIPSKMEPRGY